MPTLSNNAVRLEGAGQHRPGRPGGHLSAAQPLAREARPSAEARVIFFRSLAVMFKAGVPVERALRLLADQSEDKIMAMVSTGVADKVRDGHFLSNALAAYPGAFTRIQARLVHIGESTGVLDDVLMQLSAYEEKHRNLVMKVKSAITYPAFIFVVAFFMLVIIPPYMMEGIFQMIEGSGVEPPLLTQIVMALCEITRSGFFYALLVLVIGAGIFLVPPMLRKPALRYKLFDLVMRVPILGHVTRTIATARFSRSLAVQLEVGISPLLALHLAAEASDNPILEREIKVGIEGMREGMTVEEALAATNFFPGMLLHMVRAGEETATLGDMLGRVADMYEVELDNTLDIFTSLLEPLVMLVMGAVVGILVVSTMLPMLQVLQNL